MNEYQAKLVLIEGEYLGCGKTGTAVEYAYRDHLLTGKKVYGNIRLTFSEVDPEPAEIVLMRRYTNAILVIDEIDKVLEARGSESGSNKRLTDEISMNRKRGNTIYSTTQQVEQVDKRLRNIANVYLRTERQGPDYDRTAIIKVYLFAKNRMAPMGLEMLEDWFEVGDICDMYDTSEEVQTDRIAYVMGVSSIIRSGKFKYKNRDIYEKIEKSNPPLQKAILRNVFLVSGTADQQMVLDELGLL